MNIRYVRKEDRTLQYLSLKIMVTDGRTRINRL